MYSDPNSLNPEPSSFLISSNVCHPFLSWHSFRDHTCQHTKGQEVVEVRGGQRWQMKHPKIRRRAMHCIWFSRCHSNYRYGWWRCKLTRCPLDKFLPCATRRAMHCCIFSWILDSLRQTPQIQVVYGWRWECVWMLVVVFTAKIIYG